MKIASFNTNGIRARLPVILQWLTKEAPDVLCIQETKVQDKDFPASRIEEMGYHCSFRGQKSYNGVAVLSRAEPEQVLFGFGDGDEKEEVRLIRVDLEGVSIVNTYVPQGQSPESELFRYKLNWFERLLKYFERHFSPGSRLIWTGDVNVAPTALDVYDPEKLLGKIGYHPEEHKALSAVLQWGFVDIFRRHNPDGKAFTFWDYRIRDSFRRGLGWRIDHIFATRCVAETSVSARIDTAPRMSEKPSDHTFIVAEFDL